MPIQEVNTEIIISVKKTNKQTNKQTRTGLKILTSNIVLTGFPVLLAQLQSGNNLYKLKNEIRQILFTLQSH